MQNVQETNSITMQARRQDSLTGGINKLGGGGVISSLLRIRESGPKKQKFLSQISTNSGMKTKKKRKKGLHLKKYTNIHNFWGETTKKGSLMENLRKNSSSSRILGWQPVFWKSQASNYTPVELSLLLSLGQYPRLKLTSDTSELTN